MPYNAIYSPKTEDLDKQCLKVLFRYFSMASSIDVNKNNIEAIADHKEEELARWQILLSELRDHYELFSIRPVFPVAMDNAANETPNLVVDRSDVGPKEVRDRLVPFVSSLRVESPKFGYLTRYYIFNCVTGAHNLFFFRQTLKQNRSTIFS